MESEANVAEAQAEATLPELARRINEAHRECEQALRAGLAHALEAGRLLVEAKPLVKHGGWLPWLPEHCAFSERTGQTYMRLAREGPRLEPAKAQRVADFSLRGALAELAGQSARLAELPAPAAERVAEVLESGTPAEVKTTIRREDHMAQHARQQREAAARCAEQNAAADPDGDTEAEELPPAVLRR